MTTLEALKIIIKAVDKPKRTKIALHHVRGAAFSLGLSVDETIDLETFLDFRDRSTGEVYPYLTEKKPKRKLAKPVDWSNVRRDKK